MRTAIYLFCYSLFLILLHGGSTYGQNETRIDSIRNALKGQVWSLEQGESSLILASLFIFISSDSTIKYSEWAIEVGEEFDHPELQRKGFFNIAAAYSNQGIYVKAISNFRRSLDFSDNIENRKETIAVQINVGALYLKMKNFDESERSFLAAEALMDDETPDQYYKVLYNNLAIIYEEREDFDRATSYYLKAQTYTVEEDIRSWGLSYGNLGGMSLTQGYLEDAKVFYQRSLDKLEGSLYEEQIVTSLEGMARVCLKEEKWDKAGVYLDSMDVHIKAYESAEYLNWGRKTRASYLKGKGDLEGAFEMMNTFSEVQDSLHAEERKTDLLRLQTELEFESKEIQMTLLEEEKELETVRRLKADQFSWLFGIGLCLIALITLVLIFVLRGRNKANRTLARQNTIIEDKNELLLSQKETLETLNREKDGLVEIVAHDLKSPLNKGLALMSMIRESGEVNPAQENAIQMIAHSNQTGLKLIEDLLELNSADEGGRSFSRETVRLSDLFSETGGTFQGESIRKGITLEMIVEPLNLEIQSDPLSLSRMLENLISNALKFSKPGTQVKVAATTTDQSVVIQVVDQGPGISPEDQAKLFTKFQRLTARPTGGESSTGLGLAIVKGLVERLHGSIQVKSTLGEGTTFTITFPR